MLAFSFPFSRKCPMSLRPFSKKSAKLSVITMVNECRGIIDEIKRNSPMMSNPDRNSNWPAWRSNQNESEWTIDCQKLLKRSSKQPEANQSFRLWNSSDSKDLAVFLGQTKMQGFHYSHIMYDIKCWWRFIAELDTIIL
jgi:hypothetical protein